LFLAGATKLACPWVPQHRRISRQRHPSDWAREKSVRKLKDTLRPISRRTSGDSLAFIIGRVNRTLRGWFVYFQHSRPWIFHRLDAWLRQRFRALLRKRRKRRGMAKGGDFLRRPNAFFAEQGLFSLAAAHISACQSSWR
jgi:RNA-directed DNA polymerase